MKVGIQQSNNRSNAFDPINNLEDDRLGRHVFVHRLLKRVSDPDCSPAIGLYGGWGVGKTSILNLMTIVNAQEEDANPQKPVLEYIDVWPYEASGDLALPILTHVRKLIGTVSQESYLKNWRRVVGVLVQAGTDIGLRKLLGLQLSDVESYKDNLKDVSPTSVNLRDLETLVDDIRGTQDAFYALIQLASKAHQNRRIVFLLDNLDRCSPENVVRLLESVKNFLHASNCVWVFAMDSGVIASYIDRKYDGTSMDGNSYLDKIVPEQYHIPRVSANDMTRLHRFLALVQPPHAVGLPVIDLRKVPQLPEVLVPRRLLKSAHKFYEAYTSDTQLGGGANPDVVFLLILLYNTWPAFYERFSSGSEDHVHGILANFTEKEQKATDPISISERFTEDRGLKHYLNHCFINEQNMDTVCSMLVNCMMWLQEVGLP